MGLMQFHEHPQPRKMIQTPDVLVILYEGNAGVRQIFTDGRALPQADPQPWWYGYSVGRWDGDTLRGRDHRLPRRRLARHRRQPADRRREDHRALRGG